MAEALFLNGNPLSHQRDKSAWFNDFQHRAEGQHPNKQLGLIVLVVTEPDLIEPIGQLLSLFFKWEKCSSTRSSPLRSS